MRHRNCGGELYEKANHYYRYCSKHDGCDAESCPDAINIDAIYCRKCGQEIGGDAEIVGESAEELIFFPEVRRGEVVLEAELGQLNAFPLESIQK